MADATLRQTHPGHWSGTLNGFRLDVSYSEGERKYWGWVIAPEQYTLRVLSGASIGDVARQAREIIESPTRGAIVGKPTPSG
jgi:hypothetical protein